MAADLDSLTSHVLRALIRGDAAVAGGGLPSCFARYLASGRDDVRDALGPALAARCHQPFDVARRDRPRRRGCTLFVEAAAVVESDAILDVVDPVLATPAAEWARRRAWTRAAAIHRRLSGVGGCCDPRTIVPAAIDELERVVGAAYHPGDRLAHDLDAPARRDGDLADHVQCASALLTAYRVTARIPYAMLAEELMQSTRRIWWDEDAGALAGTTESGDHLLRPIARRRASGASSAGCTPTAVSREPPSLRQRQSTGGTLSRILDSPAVEPTARRDAAAEYGLALIEWQRS